MINKFLKLAKIRQKYKIKINDMLLNLLAKAFNVEVDTVSLLLQDESFNAMCKCFHKNAKQYQKSNFTLDIETAGKYKKFIFKIDSFVCEINILDYEAEAMEKQRLMIEGRKERLEYEKCEKDMVKGIEFARERLTEVNAVYENILGGQDHKPLYIQIQNYLNGYSYHKTSLQNAITKGNFINYCVDRVLDLCVIKEYVFDEYIEACNDYFELKEIAPEHYDENVFNNAMRRLQEYKERYDVIIIETKQKINKLQEYIKNSYEQDYNFKKIILEMVFDHNKYIWINRARKTVMNDFKDFKKFCQVYIDFVKQFYTQEILQQTESAIAVAIN